MSVTHRWVDTKLDKEIFMGKYDDIINLPHHVSEVRPRMSRTMRAAQFAPFAALTGYDDEIKETARITDCKAEIDEYVKEELNKKLTELKENSEKNPEAKITYFVADEKKSGGKYITVKDRIKKIDVYKRTVLLLCGTEIPVDDIYEIETDFCENEITS